nr:hypothetical protein 26 [bacterium]
MTKKILHPAGSTYGRLTLIEDCLGVTAKAKCQCSCGNVVEIEMRSLKYGSTKSCGCLKIESDTTHGMSYTTTYKAWDSMIQRCTNPKSSNYKYYGALGTTFDPAWKDFNVFLAEMPPQPPGTELDKDIKGGKGCKYYCKENCSWVTSEENSQKTRKTKLNPELVREARRRYQDGESVKTIANAMNINEHTIGHAIHRRTWKNVD